MKRPFSLPCTAATRLKTAHSLPKTSMSVCPCCHQPLRNTATHCPHCKADKHFGPLAKEALSCALAGLVLILTLTRLLLPRFFLPLSPWLFAFAVAGLGAGFIFAQFRFAQDRWIRPRRISKK